MCVACGWMHVVWRARRLMTYAAAAVFFLSSYVPPLVGSADGPSSARVSDPTVQREVRSIILAALVCTCTLQLCAPQPTPRAPSLRHVFPVAPAPHETE